MTVVHSQRKTFRTPLGFYNHVFSLVISPSLTCHFQGKGKAIEIRSPEQKLLARQLRKIVILNIGIASFSRYKPVWC